MTDEKTKATFYEDARKTSQEIQSKLSPELIEKFKKATDLVNEVLDKHAELFNPQDFPPDQFAEICLGLPAMIAADIIERLGGTYGADKRIFYDLFRVKLKTGLKLIESRPQNRKKKK